MKRDAFIGCLLGTAVGDSLGLPYEGLSPQRAARLFPDTTRHHFFFGKGMVSDDTEHACFVAQALIRSRGDVNVFQKQLARSFRWWLLGLPAGIGFATLRSILKLWAGIPPTRSGVFSAGNGAAMRSPILGVAMGDETEQLKQYVKASTEITHRDPKAYYAALAVALACSDVVRAGTGWQDCFLKSLKSAMPEQDAQAFHKLAKGAASSAVNDEPVSQFAQSIGSTRGISGYSYHTVPCVLQVWFHHGDNFEKGLQEIIRAGGDTDTTGAIYAGIVGARAGRQCIPQSLLNNIIEWPRSVSWIKRLADTLADSYTKTATGQHSPKYFVAGIIARNFFFLLIVLVHVLWRPLGMGPD